MSQKTAISWCDETWNPTRGCSAVSPGCAHCFAQTVAGSPFTGLSRPGRPYHGLVEVRPNGAPRWTGKVVLDQTKLQEMLRRRPYAICTLCGSKSYDSACCSPFSNYRRRPRIFVNSMSDLFHESLTDGQIASVYGVMAACDWADFLILTKRAERLPRWYQWLDERAEEMDQADLLPNGRAWNMHRFLRQAAGLGIVPGDEWPWPLPNCWLGVSVEDQERAARIFDLLRCPAAVHWASFEPLLEEVDPTDIVLPRLGGGEDHFDALRCDVPAEDDADTAGRTLRWAVLGGESGKGHRECPPGAIERLAYKLAESSVPVFVKQDSGPKAGKQGRIPDEIWARKEFPTVEVPR